MRGIPVMPAELRAVAAEPQFARDWEYVSFLLNAAADRIEGKRQVLHFAGFSLDISERVLLGQDRRQISLSRFRFDLLTVFAQHPRRVLSRGQLLEWLEQPVFNTQICRLRRALRAGMALRDGSSSELIQTVRGAGYVFTPTVTVEDVPS